MVLLMGCDDSKGVYTLYRSSPKIGNIEGDKARIHVATFDASEGGEEYNRRNCEIARELFVKQEGVTVRYWCERGKFRP